MSISITKNFCLFGTLSFQVSGIGRDNIMQSVTALKNPFKIETNLIEKLQYPYVIVISQDLIKMPRGWPLRINVAVRVIDRAARYLVKEFAGCGVCRRIGCGHGRWLS